VILASVFPKYRKLLHHWPSVLMVQHLHTTGAMESIMMQVRLSFFSREAGGAIPATSCRLLVPIAPTVPKLLLEALKATMELSRAWGTKVGLATPLVMPL
jgi:hypothetical protein